MENLYLQAVKNAMFKVGAISGGFDIIEKLVKKQRKHQDIRKKSDLVQIIQESFDKKLKD